ncbi:hypothetical protein PENTCL1PPCAC_24741, partial [Pristionchus entomophagus]
DDSNIVLRWEIDNPAVSLANRKAESTVFNDGGFEWIAGVRVDQEDDDFAEFTLTCGSKIQEEWKCEADVEFVILNTNGDEVDEVKRVKFNNGELVHFPGCLMWKVLFYADYGYVNNDKVVVEYRVNIISSEGCEPAPILNLTKLASPHEKNNVTLVI